jgi:hypoxanthine-guanine phosphoribosyltransferase
VVGYGLDFAERFRGLSFIGVLGEDEIETVRAQVEL